MKRSILFLLLLLLPCGLMAAQPALSVMALENKSGWHGYELGDGMADMLITAFAQTKKFRIMERSELKKIMEEQELGASGLVTPQTAAKIGKLLGVQYMVTGSVNQYGTKSSGASAFGIGVKQNSAEVGLDIRLIDTTTAEIIASATGQGSESSGSLDIDNADIIPTDINLGSPDFNSTQIGKATRKAVDDVVKKIVRDFSGKWKGAVMKVAGDVIFINGGKTAGIKVNDVFQVIRKGEELVDPETGETLGSEDKVIGQIKVFEVQDKFSKARAVKGTGFLVSDKVEKTGK
ncbi:MAG: CsgG/HfaB family protein [bacterium]|nr:CsgG/HfaB family protein [bacterium]